MHIIDIEPLILYIYDNKSSVVFWLRGRMFRNALEQSCVV